MTEAKPWSKADSLRHNGPHRRLRAVATGTEWKRIRAAKDGPCRRCGSPPPNDLHHLIHRSQGGSDVADCVVPLCSACHELVERRDPDACLALALSLSDREYAYVHDTFGESFFERRLGIVYTRA